MVKETHKILEDDTIGVSATTVRVPVFFAHSESVNIQTDRKLTADEARRILSQARGVTVIDDPKSRSYPLAINAAGQDDVYVGRIREDDSIEKRLELVDRCRQPPQGCCTERYSDCRNLGPD